MARFLKELRHTPGLSDSSSHTHGTNKGEEWVARVGREPGRQRQAPARTERDSTSINPEGARPILPTMPHIPPA